MQQLQPMQYSGKSIDEAIFRGLQDMQIAIDEVDIKIVQNEVKGVFGIGAKPAIVQLAKKTPESLITVQSESPQAHKANVPAASGRPEDERRGVQAPTKARTETVHDFLAHAEKIAPPPKSPFDMPKPRESRGQRENRLAREAEGATAVKQTAAPLAQAPRPKPKTNVPYQSKAKQQAAQTPPPAQAVAAVQTSEAVPETAVPAAAFVPVELPKLDYSIEAAKDLPAADFLRQLLDKMHIKASVLAAKTEGNLHLYIDGEVMGSLIGYRGETLDAMQYITSLVSNSARKDEGYIRVTLDAQNYRVKREETLTKLANRLAGHVKTSGRPRTLEPMNPYERRVIHASLQNNAFVTTHSEGREPYRRVVITPKNANNI